MGSHEELATTGIHSPMTCRIDISTIVLRVNQLFRLKNLLQPLINHLPYLISPCLSNKWVFQWQEALWLK